MRIRPVITVMACCAVSLACSAQAGPTTAQSIEAQLKGPFLMLRGMYAGDHLQFDAQGNLIGSAEVLPFSLSALRVDKVKVKNSKVEIVATREGLAIPRRTKTTSASIDAGNGKLAGSLPAWTLAPQPVSAEPWGNDDGAKIEIVLDPQHPEDMNAALKKVFSVGFDEELTNEAPKYWRSWLRHELDPKAEAEPPAQKQQPGCAGRKLPCPGLKPPELSHAPDPGFSLMARRRKYSGICVLGMIVDRNGVPQEVHIVRALGMGLDEQAVAAVEQYRFSPAMYQGRPVPISINIEVNFRIW